MSGLVYYAQVFVTVSIATSRGADPLQCVFIMFHRAISERSENRSVALRAANDNARQETTKLMSPTPSSDCDPELHPMARAGLSVGAENPKEIGGKYPVTISDREPQSIGAAKTRIRVDARGFEFCASLQRRDPVVGYLMTGSP